MSNIFKSTSRFSSLTDGQQPGFKNKNDKSKETPNKDKKEESRFNFKMEDISEDNSFKNEERRGPRYEDNRGQRYEDNRGQRYGDRDRRNAFQNHEEVRVKREKEEVERKQRELEEGLRIENFPILNSEKVPDLIIENTSDFLDKLKKEVKEVEAVKEITPGWMEIRFDKNENKPVFKYGANTNPNLKAEVKFNPLDVLHALTALYEKRKDEYINNWGEDEYEKMYRFPDYDYDYYDRLEEEEYEREMAELEEYQNDYDYDYDSY